MFKQWIRKWRLCNEFRKGFRAAFEAPDPHDRIAAARSAIEITGQIDPWPSFFLPRQRVVGRMHGAMGRAYMALRNEDPRRYSRLALEETERALESLTPNDGVEWGMAIMDLSIAHADNVIGTRADNLEKAVEAAEAALQVVDRRRNRMEWMSVAGNLAQYYAELHRGSRVDNIEKAISLLGSVLEEATAHATPFQRAHVLLDLGTLYAQRRRYDKEENLEQAIRFIEEGLAVIPPEASPLSWANGQLSLANVYADRQRDSKTENYRRAFRANDAAIAMFERIGAREQWARAQMTRVLLFENSPFGDVESNARKAMQACESALTVFTEDDYPADHREVVRSINHLRSRRHAEDRATTLEEIIDECERMLPMESDPTARAYVLVQLGNAYAERIEGQRSANIERSVELLEEAVRLLDQRADPPRWGLAMNNLAQSYLERSDGLHADNIEMAMAVSETALVVVSDVTDPEAHSAVLETLGSAYLRRVRGDRRENAEMAVQIFTKASSERNRDDDPEAWLRLQQKWREAYGLSNAGADEPESKTGAEQDAEQHFANLQSYTSLVSAADHPRTWVAAQLDLGDAYTRFVPAAYTRGDFDSLVKAYQANCRKALEIYEATAAVVAGMQDDDRWALVQDRIGHAHGLLYLWATAPTDVAPEDPAAVAAEAREHYTAAVAAHSASLRIRTLERSPRDHLRQAAHLARLHTFEGDWQAADERFAGAFRAADRLMGDIELSESDMRSILLELGRVAMLAPFVALMLGEPARALQLAEAARARLLAKALSLQTLPLPAAVRSELHELQRQLAAQERRLVSPRLFNRRTPLDESKRLRQRIRTLVDRGDGGGWFEKFPEHAREALAVEGSVVVVPVLTERGGRIVIAVGRGADAGLHVVECPAMDAVNAIWDSPGPVRGRGWQQQYIAHSTTGMPDAVLRDVGESLGRSFATPLVRALENLGIAQGAHLDVLPQGPLGLLPLGLAVDGASGMALMERYEISLSPSLSALRLARERAADRPASVLTVANPDGATSDRLPFAEMESAFLRNWFAHGRHYEGGPIAPQAVLDVLPDHSIWHFATHGRFDASRPLQSGLSLGDGGALTLEMLFETSGLGAPRLVILSACETGLYDLTSLPGEFIGLPSGFMQAGAAGVIGTLWPVDDASTALLMGCFYEKYIGDGRTPSAALRAAQLWLRDATRDELVAAVTRWSAAAGIPSASAILEAIPGAGGDAPYGSPVCWSGFVHYGV